MGTLLWCLPLAALAGWALWAALRRAKKGGGCCGDRAEAVPKAPVADRNKAHYPYAVEMKIGGMTCENCARRVENALNALDGVWARVRLDGGEAQVLCKAPPEEQALRQAVAQAGYAALSVQTKS